MTGGNKRGEYTGEKSPDRGQYRGKGDTDARVQSTSTEPYDPWNAPS